MTILQAAGVLVKNCCAAVSIFLHLIAQLDTAGDEFTIQEILAKSQETGASFGRSQINQMLISLITSGIVYKDRHGKYLFAVPLMADFIKRTVPR